MTKMSNLIGRRLLDARAVAGYSQKKLSILSELDKEVASTRINRYEVGVHEPDLPTMAKMAKALNCPLAYFYCVDDKIAEINLLLHRSSTSSTNKQMMLKVLLPENE